MMYFHQQFTAQPQQKLPIFQKNDHKWCKRNYLQQFEVKRVLEETKLLWIIPKFSLPLKKVIQCIWYDWRTFSGIGQLEKCCLLSRQYQTSCLFADLSEIGTTWQETPTTPTILTWPCTFELPLTLLQVSLDEKNLNSMEAFKNHFDQFITQKVAKF